MAKRKGTQEQEEFEDTKGVIRINISKKNRQHNGHWRYQREVIRIHISMKNRQHNGQKKAQKDKQRSIKHVHKTKDRVTRTPIRMSFLF